MRYVTVITVLFLLAVLAVPSTSEANFLLGRPYYAWHNVAGGTASIYIFSAAGAFCGVATIAGVGPAGNATVAFEANQRTVIQPVAGGVPHFGVWFTAAGAPALCGGTVSALNSYYISRF